MVASSPGRKHERHGHGNPASPTYRSWASMIARCIYPSHRGYANYGGRGIRVHPEWRIFAKFLADVGVRPSLAHSLERNKTDGHYEPGNVRWATRAEQSRNTRQNVLITVGDRTQCAADWAKESGLRSATIRARLELGWDPALAATTPASYLKRSNARRIA